MSIHYYEPNNYAYDLVGDEIAIIGVAARFAGADNIEDFWNILRDGKELVSDFPESRKYDIERYLNFLGYDEGIQFAKGSYLSDIDKFDYKFFKVTKAEAKRMDPNQRVFLETAYAAIEDAGYGGNKLVGSRTGVYVGHRASTIYQLYGEAVKKVDRASADMAYAGNVAAIIPSRLSYFLDLKGPAMLIDTACSSSTVALHTACQAMKAGDCDAAIVGGVSIKLVPLLDDVRIGIESSDSRTRTFDDAAEGTCPAEGVAVVMAKPLNKALEDHDHIYLIVKGSAMNQDGRTVGIMAPNMEAQEDVMVRAWENAKVNPERISYIEAHGTATKLGDPTEISSVKKAFRRYTDKNQFCGMGSVKTNIGHMGNVSGLASLVKMILAMKYRCLPPTINFNLPNTKINFLQSPVYVNDRLNEWESDGKPLLCGINSFGISGTNCHLVLEEAPCVSSQCQNTIEEVNILGISCMSGKSLYRLLQEYKKFLCQNKNTSMSNLCYTANTGKGHYSYRVAFVFKDVDELIEKIDKVIVNWIEVSEENGIHIISKESERGRLPKGKQIMNGEAKDIISQLWEQSDIKMLILNRLGDLYARGANIDWNLVYPKETHYRISLPTYTYEKERCWFDIPVNVERINQSLYQRVWAEEKIAYSKQSNEEQVVVILSDGNDIVYELKHLYMKKHIPVIVVMREYDGSHKSEDNLVIDEEYDGYVHLMDKLKNYKTIKFVQMQTKSRLELDSFYDVEDNMQHGIYRIMNLIRASALLENVEKLYLNIITRNACKVLEQDEVIPSNASVMGLGKALVWERPEYTVRCVDIDDAVSVDDILNHIEHDGNKYLTALRSGKCYFESVKPVQYSSLEEEIFEVKETGVYLVAGGMGGIGLKTCEMLASKGCGNIVLVGRTKIPERKDWESIICNNQESSLKNKLTTIKSIEALGAHVEYISADITESKNVKELIQTLKQKYGHINAIIQTATAGDGKIINEMNDDLLKKLLSVKIKGTWLLDYYTKDENLDAFIMFSSAMTLMGGYGGGTYTAANAYLDAFSISRKESNTKFLAIDWSTWNNTGLTEGKKVNTQKELFHCLNQVEAINTLEIVLDRKIQNVIVGRVNSNSTILELGQYLPFVIEIDIHGMQNGKESVSTEDNILISKKVNLKLSGREDQNYTENERMIGQILAEVLQMNQIDVYDNLYELGLDSVIAARVINRINSKMDIKVGIVDIFSHITIHEFAKFLDSKNPSQDVTDFYRTIPKVKEQEYYKVSSPQKRMYILQKMQTDSKAYNLIEAVMIKGELDKDNLEKAFNNLIKRHETFRTTFHFIDGDVVQKVHKECRIKIEYYEVNGEDDTRIKALMSDFSKAFNLWELPLLRVMLIKVEEQKYILNYETHHILLDGRSRYMVIKELLSFLHNRELPPLKIQYKDYSAWQNALYESEVMKEQEEYWLNKFRGDVPMLMLPTDYSRPEINTYQGDAIHFTFDDELSKRIQRYVRKNNITLNTFLLSCYFVLVYVLTRQNDIVVGSIVDGRFHVDLENVIGDFVNSIAIRADVLPDSKMQDFIHEMHVNMMEALDHQYYQFEDLVDKVNIPRRLNRNPIFDTCFNLQNYQKQDITIDYLTFTPIEPGSISSRFDLAMDAVENEQGIDFTFYYYTGIFNQNTISMMSDIYRAICENVLEESEVKISDIMKIVTREEKGKDEELTIGIDFDF